MFTNKQTNKYTNSEEESVKRRKTEETEDRNEKLTTNRGKTILIRLSLSYFPLFGIQLNYIWLHIIHTHTFTHTKKYNQSRV